MVLTVETFEKLLRISRQLSETRVLDPLLNYTMDTALDLLRAEYGYLVLLDENGELVYRVRRERSGASSEAKVSRSILGRVIETGEPVVTADATSDINFQRAESVMGLQLRSVLCVPLVTKGAVIGGLYVENRSLVDVFGDEHLKLLQFFAAQAAVAIENARLNDELEARVAHRTAELQRANAKLHEEMRERERMEIEVIRLAIEREKVEMLSYFIRDASHEFRTPLSLIRTSLHLIRKVDDSDRRETYLQHIDEQVDAILRLVEALALITRLDSGTPLVTSPVDLNHLVEASIEGRRHLMHEHGQRLHLHLAAQGPIIKGAISELTQAFMQLVDNAMQHTPEGGGIDIRTRYRGDEALIEVADTGTGIEESDLPHIFERFWRGDKAHTSRGFGLGLTIAQKIVERHHGYIEVESKVGIGSVFRIVLPARRELT